MCFALGCDASRTRERLDIAAKFFATFLHNIGLALPLAAWATFFAGLRFPLLRLPHLLEYGEWGFKAAVIMNGRVG